jgi:hypothetical protein
MKIIEDITKMKDIYEKVLNLYLREEGTCALSASLKDRVDMGRRSLLPLAG